MSFLKPTALKLVLFLGLFVAPWSIAEVLPGLVPVDPALVSAGEGFSPVWVATVSLLERGFSAAGQASAAEGPTLVASMLATWYLVSAATGSVALFLVKVYLAVFRWKG